MQIHFQAPLLIFTKGANIVEGTVYTTHSHSLTSYRTLYAKTALYYAHGTRYR